MKKKSLLFILLACASLLSLCAGSVSLSVGELFGGLLGKNGFETQSAIIRYIRLPRTFAAITAGAGLAAAGTLLQGVTGNPLAGPNIIGVNAGAGLGTVLWLFFVPSLYVFLPIAAFTGALAALICVLAVSKIAGAGRSGIVLAGIAVTSLLQAAISLISALNTDVLSAYSSFSIGSLAGVRMESLPIPALLIGISYVFSVLVSRGIDALSLGDDAAGALGINVRVLRFACMASAGICVSSVVSFAGLLGFVGLIVPHIAAKLFGANFRDRAFTAPAIGAVTVLLADTAGRILFFPSEIAVGIITAFIGSPVFFALLIKERKR